MKVTAAPGRVQVQLRPRATWWFILFDTAFMVWFLKMAVDSWNNSDYMMGTLLIWTALTGVAGTFYLFSGSETIEIDEQRFVIVRQNLGWIRHSEYPVKGCRELRVRRTGKNRSCALELVSGHRKVSFGTHLSAAQAEEVLGAVKKNLLAVADRVWVADSLEAEHFTFLKLD